MDIKGIAEAYASIYEAKKKDDEKPKKWHDDDGDGISYEDGEVDGKFPDKDGSKKKKKKDDEEKEVKEHHQKDADGNVVEHEEEIVEADTYAAQLARFEAGRQKRMKASGTYERPKWIPKDQDHSDDYGSSKGKKTTKEEVESIEEAINFAADYFLEEGIDEEELDIIIEDVGLDDFVEFVNEERAARKARASAPSYKKVKAAVDASDAAKKKAGKGEYSAAYKKKETDVTDYGDDKPAKASVKKVKKSVKKTKAAKPAAKPVAKKAPAKKAPEKKAGLISKIGSAYKKGVERHKAARAKGKEPEKRVKEFGKGFASGVKDTVKFAGKVKKAVVGETLLALLDTLEEGAEIDKFDAVLAYLIDEQIAEDFDAANKAMTSLSESLVDEIFEQQKKLIAWEEYSNLQVWGEGYQRDPERSKKNKTHSKQPDPSKDGFTGIGNMSIKDIMKMNAKMKKEGYQRNPEKGEAEERKRSKRVRGERTPMPPRGDKRREDFEKWYAANVR